MLPPAAAAAADDDDILDADVDVHLTSLPLSSAVYTNAYRLVPCTLGVVSRPF